MNSLKLALAALLLMVFSLPALAVSTHSHAVNGSTAVTITNAQHGMGSQYFGVHVYDNNDQRIQPSGSPGYSYSINASTYAVTVSFGSTFTGTVKITGPFTTHTSDSRDFAPSIVVSSGGFFKVCAGCTTTDYALRSYSGRSWYQANPSTLTLGASGNGGTVYVWLEGDKVVYGYTYTWEGSAWCTSPCEMRSGVGGFPSSGVFVPIGQVQRGSTQGTYWIENTFYDARPW